MEIRHTEPDDLAQILALYDAARAFMRETGNLTQWGEGDDPCARAQDDIARALSYVCCEDGEILAVFAFEADADDPTYRVISGGSWPDADSYGVVHRLAVAVPGRDVAGFCFDWCAARCRQLRVDTHADNHPMQRALLKNGFTRCGIIKTFDGTDRIAFARNSTYWIMQDEARRKRLFVAAIGLYGCAVLLALALVADVLRALEASWLVLVPLFVLLSIPGCLMIASRLRKGGGIQISPTGLENRLAERALHGSYAWADFRAARFGRKNQTVELLPRDPEAFFAKLPRRTRKALRQRRLRNETLPLPCLLLSDYEKKRLLRAASAHLQAQAEQMD